MLLVHVAKADRIGEELIESVDALQPDLFAERNGKVGQRSPGLGLLSLVEVEMGLRLHGADNGLLRRFRKELMDMITLSRIAPPDKREPRILFPRLAQAQGCC